MSVPGAAGDPGASFDRARSRLFLVSRQRLVREAIAIALVTRGIRVEQVDVPAAPAQFRGLRRQLTPAYGDVGLLVTDLNDTADIRTAITLVSAIELPWIVLTATPPGPAWGAVLDAGARDVLTADTELESLAHLVDSRPPTAPMPTDSERNLLVAAWRRVERETSSQVEHLIALTQREMDILVRLHDGRTVAEIAGGEGVAPGTVRGQIKSLLHKLEVGSQLEAVASFRHANDALLNEPPRHPEGSAG